jgi:hypothetical protein
MHVSVMRQRMHVGISHEMISELLFLQEPTKDNIIILATHLQCHEEEDACREPRQQ